MIEAQTTAREDLRGLSLLLSLYKRHPAAVAAAAAFLVTLALMVMSRQVGRSEVGDSSIWDYAAQSILRGQVPYRDIVEIKLPLAAYISAGAIWIGKWFGVRDLIAIRLFDFLLVGALSAVTCRVAQIYTGSQPVAAIAFLMPFASNRFIEWMSGGTEPRLGMILFGMLTLLLIAKDRPFLAGLAAALSCMCWQPGLLFAGAAFLIFSRYLSRWRDGRALKLLAGVAVPLAVTLLYFALLGAARDLWSWTFDYAASVYAPKGFRGFLGNVRHIWNVTSRVLGPEALVLLVAAAGFALFLWRRIRDRRLDGASGSRASDLHKDAILIAPSVYFLFCLVDFKSASYLIPAIPFLGIFGGLAVVELARRLASARVVRRFVSVRVAEWLPVALVLLLALGTAVRSGLSREQGLEVQTRQFKSISDLLGPDDRMYVHGAAEILAVLNRPNLNPYIFLDNNKDEYVAARTPGGFQTIVDSMEATAPKVVVLFRMNVVAHRTDIEAWVNDHYQKAQSLSDHIGYDVYLRKP